jgi:hypothetical protein
MGFTSLSLKEENLKNKNRLPTYMSMKLFN